MSQTSLPETDSRSGKESGSSGPNRVFKWISTNRWYLAGSLLVLVMVRSESQRAETPEMRRNRRTIEQMSRVERDRLTHNLKQFQSLAKSELDDVRAVHAAVQKEPKLDETVNRFHSWLATLSLQEREELLAISDPADRLRMMKRLTTPLDPMTPQDSGVRTPFSTLRVSGTDYERMIQAGAEWARLPVTPTERSPIGLLEHHVFVLSGIMNGILPGWQTAGIRSSNRPRPMIPDSLHNALLDQIGDPGIKRLIKDRPDLQQKMLIMMLLSRGLLDEARRVARSLHPSDDELEAVSRNLPEARRKELSSMSRELSDRILHQQWITQRLSPEAGKQLSRLSSMFDRLLYRPPGTSRSIDSPDRQQRSGNGFPTPRPPGSTDR